MHARTILLTLCALCGTARAEMAWTSLTPLERTGTEVVLGEASTGGGSSTDIIMLLREFGFPIFVALWFMWRLEKRLESFTSSIHQLLSIVTIMSKTLDETYPRRAKTSGSIEPEHKKDVT